MFLGPERNRIRIIKVLSWETDSNNFIPPHTADLNDAYPRFGLHSPDQRMGKFTKPNKKNRDDVILPRLKLTNAIFKFVRF